MKSFPLCTALVATLALAPMTWADVLVVDLADAAAYQDIQDAINAASAGDIVLIRPGDYVPVNDDDASVLLIRKSLTLVGDEGGTVAINALRVRDLEADDRVVLRNLEIRPGSHTYGPMLIEGLEIDECQGVVLVEGCTIDGADGFSPKPGMTVELSPNVVVSRSTIRGGEGLVLIIQFPTQPAFIGSSPGEAGVTVWSSRVAFYHSTIVGGDGGNDAEYGFPGAAGGVGMYLQVADVRLFEVTIEGGRGGDNGDPGDPPSYSGGDGLVVDGASVQQVVRAVSASWTGGAGGVLLGGGDAPSGLDLVDIPGPIFPNEISLWDDVVPEFSGPAVLREGELASLTIRGEPGELVRLFLAFDFLFAPLANKKGVFVSGSPYIGPLPIAVMPTEGVIELRLVGPGMLGLDGVVTTWQAYTRVAGSSELVLSNPYELLLVDAGL